MWHKEIVQNQFFLFYNGKLIFKKWLKNNRSVIFDIMVYEMIEKELIQTI